MQAADPPAGRAGDVTPRPSPIPPVPASPAYDEGTMSVPGQDLAVSCPPTVHIQGYAHGDVPSTTSARGTGRNRIFRTARPHLPRMAAPLTADRLGRHIPNGGAAPRATYGRPPSADPDVTAQLTHLPHSSGGVPLLGTAQGTFLRP